MSDTRTHPPSPDGPTRTHGPDPLIHIPSQTTAQTTPPPDPSARPELPGYELSDELGRGGMGVVYRGRQAGLNRDVAVKMVLGDARADSREIIRFLAEAQAAAEVRHPHVVEVYQFGENDGRPFLAMEYLPGGTLADRLKAGRLPARPTADLLARVADGVAAAHDRGIVHRDLKPANVLFAADGTPKVADFGLAKRGTGSDLTRTHAVMGTPAYMAPEQADGRAKFAGPPADVWALGVILYEAVAGRRPFDADDPMELLRRVREDRPAAPRSVSAEVPWELELIGLKCLSKEPHDRYPTAAELAADLRNWLDGRPIVARPVSGLTRAWKWAKRNRALSASLAGVVAASTAGTGVSLWFMFEARAREREARDFAVLADSNRRQAEANLKRAIEAEAAAEAYSEKLRLQAGEVLDLRKQRFDPELLVDNPVELELYKKEAQRQQQELERAAERRLKKLLDQKPQAPVPTPPPKPDARNYPSEASQAAKDWKEVALRAVSAKEKDFVRTLPWVDGVHGLDPVAGAIIGGLASADADWYQSANPDGIAEWYLRRIRQLEPPDNTVARLLYTQWNEQLRNVAWNRLQHWPHSSLDIPAKARLSLARGRFVAMTPISYRLELSGVWDDCQRAIAAAGTSVTPTDYGHMALLGMNRLFVFPTDRLDARPPAADVVAVWAEVFTLADRALAADPTNYQANRAVGTLTRLVWQQPTRFEPIAKAASGTANGAAAKRLVPTDPGELLAACERYAKAAADHPPYPIPAVQLEHARALFELTTYRVVANRATGAEVAKAMAEVVARGQKAIDQKVTDRIGTYKLMGIAAEDAAWQGGQDREKWFADALRYLDDAQTAADKYEAESADALKPIARRLRYQVQVDRGRCLYRAAVYAPGGKWTVAAAAGELGRLADPVGLTNADIPFIAEARYFHGRALWAAGDTNKALAAYKLAADTGKLGDVSWRWLAVYDTGRLAAAHPDKVANIVKQAAATLKEQQRTGYAELVAALADADTNLRATVNNLEELAYSLDGNSNKNGRGDLRASEPFQHAMVELVELWQEGHFGLLTEAERDRLRAAFVEAMDRYPWVLTPAEKQRVAKMR